MKSAAGIDIGLGCTYGGGRGGGVGDDSWSPSVHDEYLLAPGKYQLGVVMRAVGGGERGPGLFAVAK